MNLEPIIETLDELRERFEVRAEIMMSSLLSRIYKRVDLGKMPLEVCQFVPCDKNGKPLEKPKESDYHFRGMRGNMESIEIDQQGFSKALKEYQEAEQRVLFKGWELKFPFDNEPVIQLTRDKIILYYDFDENTFYTDDTGFERCYVTIEHIAVLRPELTKYSESLL